MRLISSNVKSFRLSRQLIPEFSVTSDDKQGLTRISDWKKARKSKALWVLSKTLQRSATALKIVDSQRTIRSLIGYQQHNRSITFQLFNFNNYVGKYFYVGTYHLWMCPGVYNIHITVARVFIKNLFPSGMAKCNIPRTFWSWTVTLRSMFTPRTP